MKAVSLTLAATLLAGTAMAQVAPSGRPTPGTAVPGANSNTPMAGVNSNTGVAPSTGLEDRNTGTAAAAGDRNQAVATTAANALQPARGRNSFSQGEARRRIESRGFQQVTGLQQDSGGVWRGTAMRDGSSVPVWLDYKGNVSPAAASAVVPGTTSSASPASRNIDGTTGNPPGTAATRAMDRTLGTNTTRTNPAANAPDGTPANPPGTATGRAIDRTLGTNTSGANPARTARP